MKIVHICLACFFPDNYSYQENLLPKYHKIIGNEVEVIASLQTFDKDGKFTYMNSCTPYYNEYNIKVTRLEYKKPKKLNMKLRKYEGLYAVLTQINPDVIFIHGLQFMDITVIKQYILLHPNIDIYIDNHADFSNSATNFLSKNILHKVLWKHCAHTILPYTKRFYGVLPARVEFLKNVYKLPNDKIELLEMGADDELIDEVLKKNSRNKLRKKYMIKEDDFVLVTGGKIDLYKKQILTLMEAVRKMNKPNIKLIIFGSIIPELREDLIKLTNDNIIYVGWISSEESYDYFSMSDLVVFPGRHSVFWEQVAGMGIPMIVKYWEGTTHIDVGGNVLFLKNDTLWELEEKIRYIVENPLVYMEMRNKAKKGIDIFSYTNIAKRSLQNGARD